jgi:hypothetical protein
VGGASAPCGTPTLPAAPSGDPTILACSEKQPSTASRTPPSAFAAVTSDLAPRSFKQIVTSGRWSNIDLGETILRPVRKKIKGFSVNPELVDRQSW